MVQTLKSVSGLVGGSPSLLPLLPPPVAAPTSGPFRHLAPAPSLVLPAPLAPAPSPLALWEKRECLAVGLPLHGGTRALPSLQEGAQDPRLNHPLQISRQEHQVTVTVGIKGIDFLVDTGAADSVNTKFKVA